MLSRKVEPQKKGYEQFAEKLLINYNEKQHLTKLFAKNQSYIQYKRSPDSQSQIQSQQSHTGFSDTEIITVVDPNANERGRQNVIIPRQILVSKEHGSGINESLDLGLGPQTRSAIPTQIIWGKSNDSFNANLIESDFRFQMQVKLPEKHQLRSSLYQFTNANIQKQQNMTVARFGHKVYKSGQLYKSNEKAHNFHQTQFNMNQISQEKIGQLSNQNQFWKGQESLPEFMQSNFDKAKQSYVYKQATTNFESIGSITKEQFNSIGSQTQTGEFMQESRPRRQQQDLSKQLTQSKELFGFGSQGRIPKEQRQHNLIEFLSLPNNQIIQALKVQNHNRSQAQLFRENSQKIKEQNFDQMASLQTGLQQHTNSQQQEVDQSKFSQQSQDLTNTQLFLQPEQLSLPIEPTLETGQHRDSRRQRINNYYKDKTLPVFSGAFQLTKFVYQQKNKLNNKKPCPVITGTRNSEKNLLKPQSFSQSEADSSTLKQMGVFKEQERSIKIDLHHSSQSQANISKGPYDVIDFSHRGLIKVQPDRSLNISGFLKPSFYENKLPQRKPQKREKEQGKPKVNLSTQLVKQQQIEALKAEYYENKSKASFKREIYESKTSAKFNFLYEQFIDPSKYKAEQQRKADVLKDIAFKKRTNTVLDRRIKVLKLKKRKIEQTLDRRLKESQEKQFELQNHRHGQESDDYQSVSDKDSLSNEEELILGDAVIPQDNSENEFNFDQLMNANENDMMMMLDPEYREKQAKLQVRDIKTEINQRKKQLQEMKKKKSVQINPRDLKIGRMFIESFFAAMGDSSQMGIRETRVFLRKNNVDVKGKLKVGTQDEDLESELSVEEIKEPVLALPTKAEGTEQLTVIKSPQKQQQVEETIGKNGDVSARQLRLEKTVGKIKYFKELKTSANKAFFDEKIKAKQDFEKDMTSQGSYGSTTPNQIVDRKLSLISYFLNEAVAFSLGKYLSKLNTVNLQQITLHDNGLKDLAASQLLQGVSGQRALRKLHYSRNEIGPNTAAEILKMLLRTFPYNLDDLLLEDINTTEFAMANIFEALKNAKNLRKLQLKSIKLNNPIIFDYLFTFVKQNKQLTVLKLSWGSLLPIQISSLCKRIAVKKFMTHLDLSFNTICSKTGTDYDDGKPKDMDQDSRIINSFISSMRRLIVSSQLFHLNLTGMNLGAAVRKLVEPIRIAPCLNSVHLSQNQVPAEVIFYMDRALNVPDLDPPELKVTKFRYTEVDKKPFRKQNFQPVNQQTDSGPEQSVEQAKRKLAEKFAIKIQTNQQPKQEVFDQRPLIYQRVLDMPEFTFPNRFIVKRIPTHLNDYFFSRISAMMAKKKFAPESQGLQQTEYFSQEGYVRWTKLGFEENVNEAQELLDNLQHKIDQQTNKAETQEEYDYNRRKHENNNSVFNVHKRPKVANEQCWVCDHRKQVLMVVQKDNLLLERWGQIVTDDAEIDKIKAKYLPDGQMPDILKELPILVSSINGWFPCHLMPIVPFSMFFDPILAEELNGPKPTNVLDKVQQFEKAYRKIALHASGEEILPLDIVQQYNKIWRETILSGLTYEADTLFIDFPLKDEKINTEQTYAFSTFVKPGNHKIFIYEPQTQSWYRRDIVVSEHSNDQPKVNYEQTKGEKITVSQSFFKTRKVDSIAFLKDAFMVDESVWKVGRMINKDPDDYRNCRLIVERNFEKLKDVFISLAARSNFPQVELFTIQLFSSEIGILDNLMINISTIDRLFIAANVTIDGAKNEENTENFFVRYEFLEFLIRIADQKYKVTKILPTVAQSFQKLLTDHILPFHTEYCQDQAKFRETYLLKNIIDHKICKNLKFFEHLYNQEAKLHPKKFFTKEAASNVAWKLGLGMVESLINYCYALSKLTVNDEANKRELQKRMTLVEFCEFIARLVYLKSKFYRENIIDQNQADTILTMNRLQQKKNQSSTQTTIPLLRKDIEQEIFDFSELLSAKMKAYAETQKGLDWIDGDNQGTDDEHEQSNESDFLDTMDIKSESKLTITNRTKNDLTDLLQREDSAKRLPPSKNALPRESRLLITEKDLPKSFNKLLSSTLFSGDI